MHIFQVKFVHNVSANVAVDIWVNDKPLLTNVHYKAISGYYKLEAGTYNVKVYPSGSNNKPLLNYNIEFESHNSYTVIVSGDSSNLSKTLQILLFLDTDIAETKNKALVRFIHAAAETNVPVDIYSGIGKIFSNVKYTVGSDYIEVPADTDLMINVTPANSPDVVLTVPNLRLGGGHSYTIIASGKLGSSEFPLTALLSTESTSMCTHYI
jgi:hypothetical protein